jgi:anti-sigma-K factor RskA
MSTHDQRADVGAYLLGELDAEQRAAFERALAEDAALRAEVEQLRPVVSRLDALPAEAWEDAEPPPLRLPVAAPEAPPATVTAPPPARPRRRRLVLRPAFAALAAVVLLGIGVGIGALLDDGGGSASSVPPPALRSVALDPLQAGTAAHGRALVADGAQPRVTLRLRGLPPSRAGQFYEVWLMDASGPLISIGSFRVGDDGSATLRLPLPVPAASYQYFDVSVQPEGDDASHSGESVLRGRTSA